MTERGRLSEHQLARLIAVSVLLLALFAQATDLLPARVGLVVSAALLGAIWFDYAQRNPLRGFWVVTFVMVAAYSRLGLSMGGGAGALVITLGDFLWAGYFIAYSWNLIRGGRGTRVPSRFSIPLWTMMPYLILATLLPVIGVMTGKWPLSYASPGLRQLQWLSFALFAYSLCGRFGLHRVVTGLFRMLIAVAVLHMLYGLVQFGYFMGVFSSAWVKLDSIYGARIGKPWFFYPRVTGLLGNPNEYGLYTASILAVFVAVSVTRETILSRRMAMVAIVTAFFGFLFSASRSALLGVVVMVAYLGLLATVYPRVAARSVMVVILLAVALMAVVPLMGDILPDHLTGRFDRFGDVMRDGADQDPTAMVRQEEWGKLWYIYINEYPFGTLVPTSYALKSPVDSYYVTTAIQGTPFFTLTWILFMLGALDLGRRAYHHDPTSLAAAAGISLGLWVCIMAGSGVGMTPMPQPQFIVPFWILVGSVVQAGRDREMI